MKIAVTAPDSPARVPFKMVLASVAGLWVTYFILTTLRGQVVEIDLATEILVRRAAACIVGGFVTLGLWLVLRQFDAKSLGVKIAAALILSLPVAVLIAHSNHQIFQPVSERAFKDAIEKRGFTLRRDESGDLLVDIPAMNVPTGEGGDAPAAATITAADLQGTYWQMITEIAFGRYFMLLAWCALYLALLTGEKARASERREQEFRNAAKAAELRSLRYQVNPHFLFNTLNSLSAMVLTGKTKAAERMIQMISTFYRRSLADDPTSDVPLREEFALQKLYLDIEGVRFPLRLQAVYDIPDELAETRVPGMILQPLVENSVKHAVAPSGDQVTITLSAREEYGRLVLSVSDNGAGVANGGPLRPGFGIGLDNVRQRLEARFGDDAGVVSGPQSGGGYATHLRLPIIRDADREAA